MGKTFKILIVALVIFDFFIWHAIIFNGPSKNLEAYFLNVGQGDSELVILPGNVKILIDGGPSSKVIANLSKILSATDRYIDLIILSHPQTDHFTGLIEVLKRYKVGAFIYNGQSGTAKSWQDLVKAIQQNKIPAVVLAQGDKIHYLNSNMDFLWPDKKSLKSNDPNEAALAGLLNLDGVKILFTGDIDFKNEAEILKKYDIDSDILKVSHHGSKYSTGEEFLKAASPKISVIEVGKNSYGHPTKETLNRLASVNSAIFRTDQDGLIKIVFESQTAKIYKIK